jgi:peptide deformylase
MTEIITDVEILSRPAEPLKFLSTDGVDREEGDSIIKSLIEAMNEYDNLVTLAAPQIGSAKRVFGIRFDDQVKIFIDPIITKKSDYKIAPETCASMPGKEILISRPEEVTVVYYTQDYKYEENKLLGGAARLFDQQCQLLDGVLPSELGLVSDVAEDGSLAELSDDEITELIEFYKDYVKVKLDAINKSIRDDKELIEKYKSLSFAEKVINGQATVVMNENPKTHTKAEATAALSLKRMDNEVKAVQKANLKQFLRRKGK